MQSDKYAFLKRTGTLFLSFYLVLTMFPFPLDQVPGISLATDYYEKGIDALGLWFGKVVLHLKDLQKIENTGSGDTTLDYVKMVLMLSLSALFTGLMTVLWRKNWSTRVLYVRLLIYARYYVGLYMLCYGITKLFETGQFGTPDLFRLEEAYGNSSPMGLLWTLMSYSRGYKIFSGIMEIAGGYLLLFGRTKALGAILSLGVMLNVMMMNFCFDVPVKIFSFHLVFISLLILGPDLKKLVSFLLRLKPEVLEYSPHVWDRKYKRILCVVGKGIVLIGFTWIFVSTGSGPGEGEPGVTVTDLDGAYRPTLLILDKDTLVGANKEQAWRKLVLEEGRADISAISDSVTYYKTILDPSAKTLSLVSFRDSTKRNTFSYVDEKGKLYLKGQWKGKALNAVFDKRRKGDYLLMKRGFHWVNEHPFNR